MRIFVFEEEHPSYDVIAKAAELPFPTTIFLAAHDLADFCYDRERFRRARPGYHQYVYWPTPLTNSVPAKEWISLFSSPEQLEKIGEELKLWHKLDYGAMLDLELPVKLWPILKGLRHFWNNKRRLAEMVSLTKETDRQIYTAEYPALGPKTKWLMEAFGISYPTAKHGHIRISMFYSSMLDDFSKKLRIDLWKRAARELERQASLDSNLHVGLGVTMPANLLGSQSVLSPEDLRRDLFFLRRIGVKTAIIYRLAGMTDKHIAACQKFVD